MYRGYRREYGEDVQFQQLERLLWDIAEDYHMDLEDRFCFVLGAGASRESGILTGQQLVDVWDEYIKMRDTEAEYTDWQQSMMIQCHKDKYAHYSDYYTKRFEDDVKGPIFIRNLTAKAKPSFGYLALATILTETKNNIVVTTNFDKLTETAIFRETDTIPWVVGSSNEVPYLDIEAAYPKILKVHGDMFLTMKNKKNDIARLDYTWKVLLKEVFMNYHPIFIGYAGNDPSLMSFLTEIEDRIKSPYWLYYSKDDLTKDIWHFVSKSKGCFVDGRIGFDGIMLALYKKLDFSKNYIELAQIKQQEFSDKLVGVKENLRKLVVKDTEQNQKNGISNPVILETIKSVTGDTPEILLYGIWKKSAIEQEQIFQDTIARFPNNAYVLRMYADYLCNSQKNITKAEQYYQLAIQSDSYDSFDLISFADYLCNKRNRYEDAETYYLQAIACDDKNAFAYISYADFLCKRKIDLDKAKEYYEFAVNLDNTDSFNLISYADFLIQYKQDIEQAEDYYRLSVEIDSESSFCLIRYAEFLSKYKLDFDSAEQYYRKAVEVDFENARVMVLYATFLSDVKQDYVTAEQYYKLAIEHKSEDKPSFLRMFANFLCLKKKDYKTAEYYYRQAIELDPSDPRALRSYGVFLSNKKKDYKEAERYLKEAIQLDSTNSRLLRTYANYLSLIKQDYKEAERYYQQSVQAKGCDGRSYRAYANFLRIVKEDTKEAEKYYQLAVETENAHLNNSHKPFLLTK